MMRKAAGILLGFMFCIALTVPLLAQGIYSAPGNYERATGKRIQSFHEAPMLRTKVAAGEIPGGRDRAVW